MGKRLAAALRYDASMPAPFVVARGRGVLAERLSSLAERYGVPLVENRELASRLVCLDPGTVIPQELFTPVAEILSFLLSLDGEQ